MLLLLEMESVNWIQIPAKATSDSFRANSALEKGINHSFIPSAMGK